MKLPFNYIYTVTTFNYYEWNVFHQVFNDVEFNI